MKDTQIRALKAENGKTKCKAISNGLFIEARPSGKKIFIFRYQWNKKPQTITLGQYPTLTSNVAILIGSKAQGSYPSLALLFQPYTKILP